jgi:iron(III) transport system ATP-binding protein
MAISDRILLLNNGRIEQQGTPQEMYAAPQTRFSAEFMGSNNKLQGKVTDVKDRQVTLQGDGWTLRGKAHGAVETGQSAVAVIRLEKVRLHTDPTPNSIRLPIAACMYLGDKWEYLFRQAKHVQEPLTLRAYGQHERAPDPCYLELPEDALWVLPAA